MSLVLLVTGLWPAAAVVFVLAVLLAAVMLRELQRRWLRLSSVVLVAFNVAMYARSRSEMARWANHCKEKYGMGLDCMSVGDRIGYNLDYIDPWYLGAIAVTMYWVTDHLWAVLRGMGGDGEATAARPRAGVARVTVGVVVAFAFTLASLFAAFMGSVAFFAGSYFMESVPLLTAHGATDAILWFCIALVLGLTGTALTRSIVKRPTISPWLFVGTAPTALIIAWSLVILVRV